MAYDSTRNQLVGIVDGNGDLYSVNRTTGATSLLFNGPFTNNSGLAYDFDLDRLWDIDYSGNLYFFDPTTGYSRTTALSGLGPHDGLAYVSVTSVPEPSVLALLGSGAFVYLRRRRSR